jgi:predicted outer membrane repeat protein
VITTDPAATPTNRAGRRSVTRTASVLGGAGVLAAGGAAALLAALAGSAGASATITVDSNADDTADAAHCTDVTPGNCTLRDAAAAALDGDIITFDAAVTNITLTDGTVETLAVSLTGPGSSALTITTAGAPGLYNLFDVGGVGDALISGLTLTENRVQTQNIGKFTLDDVAITGSTGAYGGALYAANVGELEIKNSRFEDNYATSNGGAVYVYNNAETTISDSVFLNNESNIGGAIYAQDTGDVSLIDSEISGNTAAESGGGVYFYMGDYAANIIGCTLDSNVAGEYGGAAHFSSNLSVVVSNTTVSNNTANGGAGLNFDDSFIDATINNSTITANRSFTGGAGIYINPYSTLTVNQSTISANVADGTASQSYGGGGIAIGDSTSVVTLSGTIVSGNTSALAGLADISLYKSDPTATGSFTAANSLIGEVDPRITANGANNVTSTDPMLGALADNGGATKTMALLTGSPAIDAGPSPVATFVGNEFDQRGTGFVRIFGSLVDIGAYEVQPVIDPTSTTTASDQPVAPAFTG